MNLDKSIPWTEVRNFPEGYGKFPYLVVRLMSAVYMQVPIHLGPGKPPQTGGIELEDVEPWMLALYEIDKYSKVHELLIERAHQVKDQLEAQLNRPARLCLVEGPEMGYYLFDGQAYTSSTIPSGGTLVTHNHEIIGMNVRHYLENKSPESLQNGEG